MGWVLVKLTSGVKIKPDFTGNMQMGLGEGSSKESLSDPIQVDLKTVVTVGDGSVPGETSVPLSVGWCHCQVLEAEEKSPVGGKQSLLLGARTPPQ